MSTHVHLLLVLTTNQKIELVINTQIDAKGAQGENFDRLGMFSVGSFPLLAESLCVGGNLANNLFAWRARIKIDFFNCARLIDLN